MRHISFAPSCAFFWLSNFKLKISPLNCNGLAPNSSNRTKRAKALLKRLSC